MDKDKFYFSVLAGLLFVIIVSLSLIMADLTYTIRETNKYMYQITSDYNYNNGNTQ